MEEKKGTPPPPGLMQQLSEAWATYNGAFAWIAAITISCALGGVMGGIGNGSDFTVRARAQLPLRAAAASADARFQPHLLPAALAWSLDRLDRGTLALGALAAAAAVHGSLCAHC